MNCMITNFVMVHTCTCAHSTLFYSLTCVSIDILIVDGEGGEESKKMIKDGSCILSGILCKHVQAILTPRDEMVQSHDRHMTW